MVIYRVAEVMLQAFLTSALDATTTPRPLNIAKRAHSTSWVGGCVSPRHSGEEKNLYLCWESNPPTPAPSQSLPDCRLAFFYTLCNKNQAPTLCKPEIRSDVSAHLVLQFQSFPCTCPYVAILCLHLITITYARYIFSQDTNVSA